MAAYNGDLETVRLLVENLAEINIQDKVGFYSNKKGREKKLGNHK